MLPIFRALAHRSAWRLCFCMRTFQYLRSPIDNIAITTFGSSLHFSFLTPKSSLVDVRHGEDEAVGRGEFVTSFPSSVLSASGSLLRATAREVEQFVA